ncbi:hypothetical protein SRHO_G00042580 [Serrasalmus rhombeus]
MRCLRCILGISWNDKVPSAQVLACAGLPTMYALLRQHRLCWLGHVRHIEDDWIPKDIFYGERILSGERPEGRPQLRHNDVCKCDMKALIINRDLGGHCCKPQQLAMLAQETVVSEVGQHPSQLPPPIWKMEFSDEASTEGLKARAMAGRPNNGGLHEEA